jgi:NADH:ubiquinone oxidoreductase subunit 4 (subunit M)
MVALSGNPLFFLVFAVVIIPTFLVVAFFFYQRRDIQPIKARYPILTLGQSVLLLFYSIILCANRIFYVCLSTSSP